MFLDSISTLLLLMKIAHVVCTYPPYRGGMGHVAFEYVERLRARGHDVHVFTPRYGLAIEGDPEYVHRVPSPIHVGNGGVVPSLFRRLSGFDLVHLHYPFFGGAEPVIVRQAIRHDQALVLTYHMDTDAQGIRGAIFEAHRRLLFPWLISRADRVLVSSQDYTNASALRHVPNIASRLQPMLFGVDLDRFFPGKDLALRTLLGIKEGTPVVLFVGGMDTAHHFKGVSIALQALAILREGKWEAVFVGEGDLRSVYMKESQSLGLGERVRFVGSIPDVDLPRYYRMADIQVFPSTSRAEAFGLVALEGAASGIPCVASDLPGVRSVVLDGSTGLLVPPGDVEALARALQSLIEHVDVREQLGASARKRAEAEFAWDPLMAKLEHIYHEVAGELKRH